MNSVDQSIYNDQREFRIGSKVYKSMSDKYQVMIDLDTDLGSKVLNDARILAEGTENNNNLTLSAIRNLDWTMRTLTIHDMTVNGWQLEPLGPTPTGE